MKYADDTDLIVAHILASIIQGSVIEQHRTLSTRPAVVNALSTRQAGELSGDVESRFEELDNIGTWADAIRTFL